MNDLGGATTRALAGGPQRHHEKASEQGKLGVRERIALLLDADSFAEEALLANWHEDGLGADGVVTGVGEIEGRPVALMANDPTVKAGSWGPKTVEKILRIQERAMSLSVPLVYLVDSAGARITEQVQMFPGRRGAGRIFHNQVKLSGVVPQVCVLFGPSAAGGAYIPAFCDVVIMREGNASMYLGSPRMAEMVISEKVTLEEMGGARMHTGVSGCGHRLVKTDQEGMETTLPLLFRGRPSARGPGRGNRGGGPDIARGGDRSSERAADAAAHRQLRAGTQGRSRASDRARRVSGCQRPRHEPTPVAAAWRAAADRRTARGARDHDRARDRGGDAPPMLSMRRSGRPPSRCSSNARNEFAPGSKSGPATSTRWSAW